MRRLSPIALACVLSLTAIVFAQLGTARISGTVSDSTGAAVAQARVVVKNKATGQTRETTSADDGVYTIQNLLPATYEVRVEARGFAPVVVDSVDVRVGEVPTVNVSLKPA